MDGVRDVLLTGLTVQNGVDGIVIIRGNGRDGLGVFTLSRLNLSGAGELRSEPNTGSGILVSSTSIVSCSTDSTVILDGNADPFTVSVGSSLSSACEGATPASQGVVTQRAVNDAPAGEAFGD